MNTEGFTTHEVARAAGISFHKLNRWIYDGHVVAERDPRRFSGSGNPRRFTAAERDRVIAIAKRVRWGMTVEAAARPVDPPLPAPAPKSSTPAPASGVDREPATVPASVAGSPLPPTTPGPTTGHPTQPVVGPDFAKAATR